MASVNDSRERTRLDAPRADDGRQALNPARLLHYDLTAGSVTVQAVADQLPAAARVRSLQQALGGALAPLASGLLIVPAPRPRVGAPARPPGAGSATRGPLGRQ